jgi:uncharacterized membrane protein
MRRTTQDSALTQALPTNWRLWLIRLLSLAGMGISGYLTWAHLAHRSVICGQSQGCDIVQQSVYSEIGGVPVALFGLLAYSGLFLLTLVQDRGPESVQAYVPLAIFGVALVGVLYSAYLTYLELYVIYAICQWCVTQAVVITLILLLSLPGLKAANEPA